jgi:hypothetical protein
MLRGARARIDYYLVHVGGEAQKQVAHYASLGVIVDRTVIARMADSPGQRCHTENEVNEMLVSPAGRASTTDPPDEPMLEAPSAAPSVEESSTEVLISTQQVAFNTAAAVGVRRENIGDRLVAIMRRIFATSTDASRPRKPQYPKRYAFLEDALMAREMDRL